MDPETPGADDVDLPDDWVDSMQARLDADPLCDPLQELRKVAKNKHVVDDMLARKSELYARMAEALRQPGSMCATPETARAIRDYHKSVVEPLIVKLTHELLGVQMELALHKADLEHNAKA